MNPEIDTIAEFNIPFRNSRMRWSNTDELLQKASGFSCWTKEDCPSTWVSRVPTMEACVAASREMETSELGVLWPYKLLFKPPRKWPEKEKREDSEVQVENQRSLPGGGGLGGWVGLSLMNASWWRSTALCGALVKWDWKFHSLECQLCLFQHLESS